MMTLDEAFDLIQTWLAAPMYAVKNHKPTLRQWISIFRLLLDHMEESRATEAMNLWAKHHQLPWKLDVV